MKHELPGSVVGVCVAVIADYDRRRREIERGVLSEYLLSEYKRYNAIVEGALMCVEPAARAEFLDDIASGRGYIHSMIGCLYCKKAYYDRKRSVVYTVAVGLGLAE
jgi:hypothetical protein